MIIGGLAAAVVVLTGGYDRLRDYVELWTGDRFLPETTNGQVFGSSPSSGTEDMEPGLPELVRERNSQVIRHTVIRFPIMRRPKYRTGWPGH